MSEEKKKQMPTKQFLLEQIRLCQETIQQNQGALNLCMNMLKNECYVTDEKEKEKGV